MKEENERSGENESKDHNNISNKKKLRENE